ncbi:MAG TPA: PBP1A family penicillin-binding protein, partial [Rubrobacteraceae bacterium]|nr:PBP1A family penicillin-binding protein [Rubrobacteraceae bacterium]
MDLEDLARVSRRRKRRQIKHQSRGRAWGIVRILLVGLFSASLLSAVAGVGAFAYTYRTVSENLPELDRYRNTELAQTSVVYNSAGEVVDELHGVQNRFVVDLSEVDPTLRDAVVAIEDQRFYEHRGLDFEAVGRAAWENVRTLSIQEGGSTITQQLVKNTYIAQEQRQIPSFRRKMAEASLAWQYEEIHSKDEILEQYLNTVYFGANAYGAEAAARTYYNKAAADLALPESAMLAGIINLPGTYDPFSDPESAKKRRNVVLDRMLEHGYLDEEEHAAAVAEEIELSRGRVEYENDNEYFLDAVRKELAEEYGDQGVYEGGLKIYTTLDPRLQELAATSVDDVVNPEEGGPSASLVSVDPETGAVKAMVGGSDFQQVKFNLATQGKRQPGSAFKTFVLSEAIRQGISTDTRYLSDYLEVPMGEYEEPYVVQNYDFHERGPINLKTATEQSDNTVYVQLALDLGLENVVDMASKMGIESALETYPSTAIGGLGEGVSPYEMASAYSTLANGGMHMEPYLVEKVTREEDGEEVTIQEHEPEGKEALTRDQAAAVTQTLRGVVERGTASRYRDLVDEIDRPSAGKTGTSENFVDAWYIGYVPQLTTSVWVGYPEERVPMVNINGLPEINGENYPLDIWSLYMQGAV